MKSEYEGRFGRLILFLKRLQEAKIPHRLDDNREDAISVLAFAPSEYWEIDFLADGEVDVERYRSNGVIEEESSLEALFAVWKDDVTDETPSEDSNAAVAGK